MNERAANQWKKARIPFGYYQTFLRTKQHKHILEVTDLLFIANFKGGSATLAEPESGLSRKLPVYSRQLETISEEYGERNLGDLDESEIGDLVSKAVKFVELTRDGKHNLDGFGPSFASALLNAHFPSLLPILDKRALSGAKIMEASTNSQGQVKGIEKHYESLIRHVHSRMSKDRALTIESMDRELFSEELDDRFKSKNKRRTTGVGP